jgi:hypothetical protein
MAFVTIEAASISGAWTEAMAKLFKCDKRKAIHTVVRITSPVAVVDGTWQQLDDLLARRELYSIETVANTIFPYQIAATSRDHTDLVRRYRAMYDVIQQRLPINRLGTYFGRLVGYPRDDTLVDQLGAVIDHIGIELGTPRPKGARYEAAIAHPDDLALDAAGTAVGVYLPGTDNGAMGFPCLSHCSFQIDPAGQVHLLAQYRSQYMVQRGYGNYVGLARLLGYVADQTGLQVGHLTVVAGLAQIETSMLGLRELVAGQQPLLGAGA